MSATNRGIGRYVVVSGLLVLAGLVVWVLSTPAVAGLLFGEAAYEAAYSSPLYGFFGLPLLALPPLIAGFVLPKGFFIWGVATVVPYLPAALWLTIWTGSEVTFQTSNPGVGQILSLVFVELMIFLFFALACTGASGLGAGARYLIRWWTGRLGQDPLGAG